MKPRLRITDGNLRINNNELLRGQFKTYLNASVASGSGTITVDDPSIAVSEYLLIGKFGDPDAEIVLTHASTTPSGLTITLAANTTKAHTESDPVYIIDWNQIEFSRATTSGGSKSVLATQDIEPTQEYSLYNDVTNTTGFGYARFKNVIDSNTFSEYSVEVPYTSYAIGTVGEAVQAIYDEFKATPDIDFAFRQVNDCLDDINSKKRRWTPSRVLDYDMGTTSDLVYSFDLPTDIRNSAAAESIIEVRLGDKEEPLTYLDYQVFKLALDAANLTTVSVEASSGDTTITLTDSNDFDESGTISIPGQDANITYTANNESTGVLSGIPASGDGSITATLTAGSNVWQEAEEGEPEYWTVDDNGALLINPMPDSDWINKNIFIDYYKDIVHIDDLADTLDVTRTNLVKMWLRWKVRAEKENNGVASIKDPDYQRYQDALNREAKMDKGDDRVILTNVRDLASRRGKGFDITKYNLNN